MKIATDIVINKPIATVWNVVGTEFANAHLWASALNHSEADGRKINGQVCESRICDVQGMGRIREKLLEFDAQNHALRYEVVEGFPFFVARGVNRWHLTTEGERTRVSTHAEIVTKGLIGAIMQPMMKMQMFGLMRKTLEDLKFYVEIDTPARRRGSAEIPLTGGVIGVGFSACGRPRHPE